jgi:glutathione peroxidase
MSSLLLGLLTCAACSTAGSTAASNAVSPPPSGVAGTIYDFTKPNIDSHTVHLSKYKGKVLLVVNVASKCGYTPQYAGLEALYKEYENKGFVILGFPANNFNEQEPGTNSDIKLFCTSKYNVTFPMFSKISVKGADEDPLYKWLIASSDRPNDDIEWNFCKFLIGKDGKVIARFKSEDTPESSQVRSAIDAALKS